MSHENHLFFHCKGTKSLMSFLSHFRITNKIHSSHIILGTLQVRVWNQLSSYIYCLVPNYTSNLIPTTSICIWTCTNNT